MESYYSDEDINNCLELIETHPRTALVVIAGIAANNALKSNRLEKPGYASTVSSCVQNGGLWNKIKNFYAYENEWKTWSDRDKLYWTITITIIILAIIAVLCA